MNQMLFLRLNIGQVVNRGSLMLLLTAPVLLGQAGQRQLPYVNVRVTSTTPLAESNIVTVRELGHVVPKKAHKEAEKAENARAQEQSATAIEHYNRAIEIDPEFVAARNNLAVMYLVEGNGEAAVAQLEEAAKIDAHSPALFCESCSCLHYHSQVGCSGAGCSHKAGSG